MNNTKPIKVDHAVKLDLHCRLLDIWNRSLGLLGIKPRDSPIISISSADCNPDVFVRHLDIHQLAVSTPSQTRIRLHRTVSKAAVENPLLHDHPNELDLSSEVIGLRDTLNHGVDFGTFANCGFAGSRGFIHEVQKCL